MGGSETGGAVRGTSAAAAEYVEIGSSRWQTERADGMRRRGARKDGVGDVACGTTLIGGVFPVGPLS